MFFDIMGTKTVRRLPRSVGLQMGVKLTEYNSSIINRLPRQSVFIESMLVNDKSTSIKNGRIRHD